MRISRLYTPQALIQGEELVITGQTAHHLAHVLRVRSGASVQVFDGKGCEHRACVTTIKRTGIMLEIAEPVAAQQESSLDITLLQGITRNDRMDLILQKAVELGVKTIQPIWMQRSQAHMKGTRIEKRVTHWLGVIIGACEQCGRATVPHLSEPMNFTDCMLAQDTSCLRFLLQPGSTTGLGAVTVSDKKIHLLVGPEGGLNTDEQSLAKSAGFTGIHLGQRILRTETAALAALAGMQALWGDFS
jgi:16S rRNA (uracil1498-N3)-methyltransferase